MKRIFPLFGLGLTALIMCPDASLVAAVAEPSVVDPCTQATDDAIETIRTVLDRIETDPQAALDVSDEMTPIFDQIGTAMGRGVWRRRWRPSALGAARLCVG